MATRTLAEAIAQGYVIVRNAHHVSNEFWRYCENADTPFVRIRPKKAFAIVSVDLLNASYTMSEPACREINGLLKQYHVGQWTWFYSGMNFTYKYSPRIPIDRAVHVAQQILIILAKPGYREPRMGMDSPLVAALDSALTRGMVLA